MSLCRYAAMYNVLICLLKNSIKSHFTIAEIMHQSWNWCIRFAAFDIFVIKKEKKLAKNYVGKLANFTLPLLSFRSQSQIDWRIMKLLIKNHICIGFCHQLSIVRTVTIILLLMRSYFSESKFINSWNIELRVGERASTQFIAYTSHSHAAA